MNLVPWIVARALGAELRPCPRCDHEQRVARSRRDSPVRCERCGGEIPVPEPPASRRRSR